MRRVVAALAPLMLASAASGAVTYTVTYLQPAGYAASKATAASDTLQAGYVVTASIPDAGLVWSGNSSSFVPLTPAGYRFSTVAGLAGNQAVGVASTFSAEDAFLWSTDGTSAIKLTPATADAARALATDGTHQTGWISVGGHSHAALWSGSADSVIDLDPGGYFATQANGVSGDIQVGSGTNANTSAALLWHSTSAATNLTPPNFTSASATGISGTQIVGTGSGTPTGAAIHALLWLTPTSAALDLNPGAYLASVALATNGVQQVGNATAADGSMHAALWSSSADSFVDLQQFLDPSFASSSALAIAPDGVIVGYASNPSTFQAVMWTPVAVPEAGTAGILALGIVGSLRRRRISRPQARRARPA